MPGCSSGTYRTLIKPESRCIEDTEPIDTLGQAHQFKSGNKTKREAIRIIGK